MSSQKKLNMFLHDFDRVEAQLYNDSKIIKLLCTAEQHIEVSVYVKKTKINIFMIFFFKILLREFMTIHGHKWNFPTLTRNPAKRSSIYECRT